jgi:hypothetical protein
MSQALTSLGGSAAIEVGFRFRRPLKILPGVRLNFTQRGLSSTSVGKRGAMLNFSRKGTRGTVGIPGSGPH